MKNNPQGRPRKDFDKSPIDTFLMDRFCKFAWDWKHPNDLKRLGIECAPNEWPIVGAEDLLPTLLGFAAEPDKIQPDSKRGKLLLVCLRRSPDFVLALMTHIRNEIRKLKPSKRNVLFGNDKEKLSPAEAEQRREARKLSQRVCSQHDEASRWHRDQMLKNTSVAIGKIKSEKRV